jgi:hypothetical protein
MCVGVTLWCGWGGVVSGLRLKHYWSVHEHVSSQLVRHSDGEWWDVTNMFIYAVCMYAQVVNGQVSEQAKLYDLPDQTISVETFGPIKPDLVRRYVPLS